MRHIDQARSKHGGLHPLTSYRCDRQRDGPPYGSAFFSPQTVQNRASCSTLHREGSTSLPNDHQTTV
ncbi:hypothetical protein EVA_15039 [gut metagenome]|uniref:Uncharacterized protein n=1 Tax=gut metagenome TaxID=749906 RepID=J9GBR2_9ZZZZ